MYPDKANSLAVVFSSLALAAEKQQRYELSEQYRRRSDAYLEDSAVPAPGMEALRDQILEDINSGIGAANQAAVATGDRGGQRAMKWGEKVAKIQKSLLDRFLKQGEALLEGTGVFVCQSCGFIFLGDQAPEVCPVCKVPSLKFQKIA
jgi:rubrerythrin